MTAAQMAYEFKIGYDNITNLAAPGYNEREISTLLTKAQEQLYYGIINPESNKLNDGIESTEKRRVDLSEFIRDAECTLSSNQVGAHQYGVFFDLPSDFFYTLSEDAHSNIPDCTQPGSVELFLDPSSLDLASAQFTIGETITDGLSVYTIVSGAGSSFIINLVSGTGFTAGAIITGAISGATGTVSKVRPIYTQLFVKVQKHDAYISNWFNPFKRPYNELCWRMDYSKETVLSSVKRHELISDGTYNIIDYNIRYYKRPSPIIVPTAATFPQFVIDGITVPPGYAGKDCELDPGVHRQIVDIAVRLAVAALQETQEYQVKSIESLKSE